jgi:5-methylcytosine-specific restriction endonuclease McrA
MRKRSSDSKKPKKRKSRKKKTLLWIQVEIRILKKRSYFTFLRSRYWAYIKKRVLKRDKNMCKKCGYKSGLQVHHKTYKNHFNEHNHLGDLITLCRNCHKAEHKISPPII